MAVEIPQTISDAGSVVLADDPNASATMEYDMLFSNLTINGIGHEVYQVAISKPLVFRTAADVFYGLAGATGDTVGQGSTARQLHVLRFGFNGSPSAGGTPSLFATVPGEYATGTSMIAIAGGSLAVNFPYTTTVTLLYSGSTYSGGYGRLRTCWMETRMFRR